MSPARGRTTWIVCAVLALGVVLSLAYVLRGHALEWWWAQQLELGSEEEKQAAFAKLVQVKSSKAIPFLAKRVEEALAFRSFRRREDLESLDSLKSLLSSALDLGIEGMAEVLKLTPDWNMRLTECLDWQRATPLIFKCLDHQDSRIVSSACQQLRIAGSLPIERWEELLDHADVRVRALGVFRAATWAMEKGHWRRVAREILESSARQLRSDLLGDLQTLLDAPSSELTRMEVQAWIRRGRTAVQNALKLQRTLRDEWAEDKYHLLPRLGDLGPAAGFALPLVVDAFRSRESSLNTRMRAFPAWASIDPDSVELRDAAFELLAGDSGTYWSLRRDAIRVLERAKPPSEMALKLLPPLLEDPDNDLRHAAARALWRLRGNGVELILVLREGLHNRTYGANEIHAEDWCALAAEMGPAAAPVVPDLIALLQPWSKEHSVAALEALGRIGPGAAEVVPALVALLGDFRLSSAAARVLQQIGKPAAPALAEVLRQGTLIERWRAVCVLRGLGAVAFEASSALEAAAAHDPDEDVQAKATAALAAIRAGRERE